MGDAPESYGSAHAVGATPALVLGTGFTADLADKFSPDAFRRHRRRAQRVKITDVEQQIAAVSGAELEALRRRRGRARHPLTGPLIKKRIEVCRS